METFCHLEEDLLDVGHVLHSPGLGAEGRKKEVQGLSPDLQEFYIMLRDWTHTQSSCYSVNLCVSICKSDQDLIS